jgi:AcrR family transcriptional regulator
MAKAAAKKLSKTERRRQLLETAHRIVREEGTDALTLGHLAERAGVSKPIAYEHFETRAGLLIALYQAIDDRHVAALRTALRRAKQKLPEIARVVAEAYFECYRAVGPEWQAISAALRGDEAMDAFHQSLIDRYVKISSEAFAPYSKLGKEALRLRCLGFIGAGEALARDLAHGRTSDQAAAAALAALIFASLAR